MSERREPSSFWRVAAPGAAALLIAILMWLGALQARSQQLVDLSDQVSALSNEISEQQQQTNQELRHLQTEIDEYLLRQDGVRQ